jgi:peptidyl-tRNA hydrolase, PTH2 family
MADKPIKQVIVIRRDLNMRRGKEIAQGAHAAMAWLTVRIRHNLSDCDRDRDYTLSDFTPAEEAWIKGSFRKVVCQADSLRDLMTIHEAAEAAGLEAQLITDNGITEFGGVPTITALAIGPDYDERLDPVTRELVLY